MKKQSSHVHKEIKPNHKSDRAPIVFSSRSTSATSQNAHYIVIDDSLFNRTTSNKYNYFREYEFSRVGKNQAKFPLVACDPLEIKNAGELRYFFTSASERGAIVGEALQLLNPQIDQVIIVRACDNSGDNTLNVYVGIETTKTPFDARERIYPGKILLIETVRNSLTAGENQTVKLHSDCMHLSGGLICKEVIKNLEDAKTHSASNPIFIEKLKLMFCTSKEINWMHGGLISRICYWPDNKSILKGALTRDIDASNTEVQTSPSAHMPILTKEVIDLE